MLTHTDDGEIVRIAGARVAARREKRFMKKGKLSKSGALRASYELTDFPKSFTRGKYAARFASESNIARLDPEIYAAFPTSKTVNDALGALLRIAKMAVSKSVQVAHWPVRGGSRHQVLTRRTIGLPGAAAPHRREVAAGPGFVVRQRWHGTGRCPRVRIDTCRSAQTRSCLRR